MIKLVCDKNRAFFRETEKLTSGSVGVTINFVFSPEWDGLLKTAVFDAGEAKIDVVLTSESCEVPPEVLACPGKQLSVGVFGELPDKTLVIPTIYAEAGIIRPGASPSGMSSAPPTPSWPEQVQAIALKAKEVADSVRNDADEGKFNGAKGEAGGWYTPAVTQPDANTMRVAFTPSKEGMPDVEPKDIILPAGGGGGGGSGEDGGYYTPAVTQPTENTMQVSFTPSKATMPAVPEKAITLPAGAKGETGSKGDKGDKGADGKSAYRYAVEGGYTGTEAEFAAKLAAEKLANPNALTFTGAVTGSYDGSEALTVEIPSGGSGGSEWQTILTGETTVEAVTTVIIPMTASDFDEYRAVIVVGKNTDGTTTNNNTNIWIDGYLCAYYMLGINYGNYVGTFSISVEPIPETSLLESNGNYASCAKKSTVDSWMNSPLNNGSGATKAIICRNTSPTGVLRIQFGTAYSGTIRHEVMAR